MKTTYVCSLLLACFLFLQNEKLGEVKGDVLDMRGKPIASALVVYTNIDNKKTYSVKTDPSGNFIIVGLMLGTYDIRITRPTGEQIYSGRRRVYAIDRQAANVTEIDLSLMPTKASLAPFLGVKAEELQKESWRNTGGTVPRELTEEQREELHKENALIASYNELTPQAQEAIKAQDWPQAATLLQQLIVIAPYKWELYQNMGSIQRRLGQFKEAVQSLENGARILAGNAGQKQDQSKTKAALLQMRIEEGETDVAMGNTEDAASHFRAAAQLDPKSALAFLHLCTAEYNSGHPDSAMEACTRAIALEPGHSENYQVLAGIQSNLERYQEALATYKKGITAAQNNIVATRPSAQSNINSRRFSNPAPAMAEAVRAGQMLQSVGNIYFQLKDYPKAAESFSQSARLHPYPALPLFNLCATLFDMNNFLGAAEACDHAIQTDPKVPEPYFVKASALYGDAANHGKLKGSREVRSSLEKYLQLAPEGFYANDARNMLKEMAGNN
ncbi:MAG TPA: tetratricopeptide repeat protein [Candidatus Angelobacter sp.]